MTIDLLSLPTYGKSITGESVPSHLVIHHHPWPAVLPRSGKGPTPSVGDPSLADSGADKDPVAAEQVAPIEIDPPVADLYPVPAYAKAGVSVDGRYPWIDLDSFALVEVVVVPWVSLGSLRVLPKAGFGALWFHGLLVNSILIYKSPGRRKKANWQWKVNQKDRRGPQPQIQTPEHNTQVNIQNLVLLICKNFTVGMRGKNNLPPHFVDIPTKDAEKIRFSW